MAAAVLFLSVSITTTTTTANQMSESDWRVMLDTSLDATAKKELTAALLAIGAQLRFLVNKETTHLVIEDGAVLSDYKAKVRNVLEVPKPRAESCPSPAAAAAFVRSTPSSFACLCCLFGTADTVHHCFPRLSS